jgi:hypothetical protein
LSVARRTVEIEGETWRVYPSGRVTVYARDEFGLVFQRGSGAEMVRRFARYSPLGARRRDASLAALSDRQLTELFRWSQPAWTSPDARASHDPATRAGR